MFWNQLNPLDWIQLSASCIKSHYYDLQFFVEDKLTKRSHKLWGWLTIRMKRFGIFPTERHVKCLLTSHVWSNIPNLYLFISKRSISRKAVARHDGQRSYQNIPYPFSRISLQQKEKWYMMVMIKELDSFWYYIWAPLWFIIDLWLAKCSRIILIMSLKAPHNILGYRQTRLWFGNNLPLLHFGLAYQTGLCPPPVSVHCCTKRPPSVYCCYKEKTHYIYRMFSTVTCIRTQVFPS